MTESLEPTPQDATDKDAQHRAVVVGIGASAGGIAALQKFFGSVEADGGTAYVVILHLSPDHDSRLAEVLQSTARISVRQVTETTAVAADQVYVVPPNKRLGIVDGMLTLSEFTSREQRLAPVDAFFRVLADTHGSRSACVILSGTGPNGSAGLKRIKEYGGLVVVQDPSEAEYADMPRNAIATGLVDMILPVAEIPAKIRAYFDGIGNDGEHPLEVDDDPEAIRQVLSVLRVRTGHDFTDYKAATLQRRIERRMMLRGIASLPTYAELVRQEPEEVVSLMKELLISVTNFFRDPHAWNVLRERVIPRLFESKDSVDPLRVWVAGCATGEEAYSVAMLLTEHASGISDPSATQVFATDLDRPAIERAREALYVEAEIADVSEERLQRFFTRESRGYRIRRELRELVLFAPHNLVKDPPFSHLDLICCRNVMIYLNRALQERLVDSFHFALQPGGFLFLGGSETPDGPTDLFQRFDADAHIYQARTVTSRVAPRRSGMPTLGEELQPLRPADRRATERVFPADLHQRLLDECAPPSVIVNEDHNIVHMSDRVVRYLQMRGGEPSRDLLLLARPELRADLRSALHQAARERGPIDVRGVGVAFEDGARQVDIHVKPVLDKDHPARGYFVVLFEERTDETDALTPVLTLTSPVEPAARQLENELIRAKAQLRTTIEQYETQAEEAQASNEELQAMNEELRSAAEELETSKEELQSVNEELTTVNQELKIKIEELGLTNNDFQNFINATNIGTIFLDRSMRLKLSTPRAREVFNLLESDVGRPLSDITSRLQDVGIHDDARTVLDRLSNIEREVQSENGRWHLMRLLPYRTKDDRIDGVVITFQDITERRAAEVRVRQSDERLRLLIEGAQEYAMFTITPSGEIDSWNSGAQRVFGYSPDEMIGAHFSVLFTADDRANGVPTRELKQAAQTGHAMDERHHVRKDGVLIYCSGVTRRLGSGGMGFAKISRDMTAERQAADALLRANDNLEARIKDRIADLGAEVVAHQAAKVAMTRLAHRLVTSQEDERRRIARDLHDDLGQRITALRLALERNQEAPDLADIERALQLVSELGAGLDFLSWQLRPAVLDELGLAAALPRYVTQWSSHTGVPVELKFAGYQEGQLPKDAEVAFYRITQEALTNVAKHSHATRVDVVLGANDGEVVLVIEDDGVGFDVEAVDGAAFGLLGMRERAALANATLQIESTAGRGTAVFLKRARKQAPAGADAAV